MAALPLHTFNTLTDCSEMHVEGFELLMLKIQYFDLSWFSHGLLRNKLYRTIQQIYNKSNERSLNISYINYPVQIRLVLLYCFICSFKNILLP